MGGGCSREAVCWLGLPVTAVGVLSVYISYTKTVYGTSRAFAEQTSSSAGLQIDEIANLSMVA